MVFCLPHWCLYRSWGGLAGRACVCENDRFSNVPASCVSMIHSTSFRHVPAWCSCEREAARVMLLRMSSSYGRSRLEDELGEAQGQGKLLTHASYLFIALFGLGTNARPGKRTGKRKSRPGLIVPCKYHVGSMISWRPLMWALDRAPKRYETKVWSLEIQAHASSCQSEQIPFPLRWVMQRQDFSAWIVTRRSQCVDVLDLQVSYNEIGIFSRMLISQRNPKGQKAFKSEKLQYYVLICDSLPSA